MRSLKSVTAYPFWRSAALERWGRAWGAWVLALAAALAASRGVARAAEGPAAPATLIRLVPADWNVSTAERGGASEWGTDPARPAASLFVYEGLPGIMNLISRKALEGDFDVQVGVQLKSWQTPPGSVLRVMLAAGRPEDSFQRLSFVLFRETHSIQATTPRDGYQGLLIQSGKVTRLPGLAAGPADPPMRLRLQRTAGRLTASHRVLLPNPAGTPVGPGQANQPGWAVVARYEPICTEPLSLVLSLSNTAGSSSTAYPYAGGTFVDLQVQGAGSGPVVARPPDAEKIRTPGPVEPRPGPEVARPSGPVGGLLDEMEKELRTQPAAPKDRPQPTGKGPRGL